MGAHKLWTNADVSYEKWCKGVDAILIQRCGMNMACLPDWLSRDAYDDGLTCQDGAEICLEEAEYY